MSAFASNTALAMRDEMKRELAEKKRRLKETTVQRELRKQDSLRRKFEVQKSIEQAQSFNGESLSASSHTVPEFSDTDSQSTSSRPPVTSPPKPVPSFRSNNQPSSEPSSRGTEQSNSGAAPPPPPAPPESAKPNPSARPTPLDDTTVPPFMEQPRDALVPIASNANASSRASPSSETANSSGRSPDPPVSIAANANSSFRVSSRPLVETQQSTANPSGRALDPPVPITTNANASSRASSRPLVETQRIVANSSGRSLDPATPIAASANASSRELSSPSARPVSQSPLSAPLALSALAGRDQERDSHNLGFSETPKSHESSAEDDKDGAGEDIEEVLATNETDDPHAILEHHPSDPTFEPPSTSSSELSLEDKEARTGGDLKALQLPSPPLDVKGSVGALEGLVSPRGTKASNKLADLYATIEKKVAQRRNELSRYLHPEELERVVSAERAQLLSGKAKQIQKLEKTIAKEKRDIEQLSRFLHPTEVNRIVEKETQDIQRKETPKQPNIPIPVPDKPPHHDQLKSDLSMYLPPAEVERILERSNQKFAKKNEKVVKRNNRLEEEEARLKAFLPAADFERVRSQYA